MTLEYGSCYKNVKEAAYKSVSTAMRRYLYLFISLYIR